MGSVNSNLINSTYALAKDRDGTWKVAIWTNGSLWSRDGNNKKLCKRSEMTRWKFFTEVEEYVSASILKVGDRVAVSDGNRSEFYWVIDTITTKDKKQNKYYIGL